MFECYHMCSYEVRYDTDVRFESGTRCCINICAGYEILCLRVKDNGAKITQCTDHYPRIQNSDPPHLRRIPGEAKNDEANANMLWLGLDAGVTGRLASRNGLGVNCGEPHSSVGQLTLPALYINDSRLP